MRTQLKTLGLLLVVVGSQQPIVSHAVETNWTGVYVGVVGGHSWGSTDNNLHSNAQPVDPSIAQVVNASFYTQSSPVSNHFGLDGFSGGGELGYNYQVKQFVIGIEGDMQYQGITKSNSFTDNGGVITVLPTCQATVTTCNLPTQQPLVPGATHIKNDWYSTLRGRVGMTHNNFMGYVTGGLAMSQYDMSINTYSYQLSSSSVLLGYAVGAGLEYKVLNNISLKAEYLYLGFQNSNASYSIPYSSTISSTSTLDQHTFRVGVNYHF